MYFDNIYNTSPMGPIRQKPPKFDLATDIARKCENEAISLRKIFAEMTNLNDMCVLNRNAIGSPNPQL